MSLLVKVKHMRRVLVGVTLTLLFLVFQHGMQLLAALMIINSDEGKWP